MKRWLIVGLLALAAVCPSGCGKKSNSTASASAFASAAPELKTAWDAAAAALQTNDYATAFFTLRQMARQPGLPPAQVQAIQAQTATVHGRMNTAAQKGDAAALQALDDIRKASRTHPSGQ